MRILIIYFLELVCQQNVKEVRLLDTFIFKALLFKENYFKIIISVGPFDF
jgi:hypothetical protein